MWKWIEYAELLFDTPDKNKNDRNSTKQELLFFNILLPEVVWSRPTIVRKGESPDFMVQLADGAHLYVEVVTAVDIPYEDDAAEGISQEQTVEIREGKRKEINQEKRWAEVREGRRDNKRYTTKEEVLERIVAEKIEKKRHLANGWAKKRPIILLVGLVGGPSGLGFGFHPETYVKDIHPFQSIIIGNGTIQPRIFKPAAKLREDDPPCSNQPKPLL